MKNMIWAVRLLPVIMILIFTVSCRKEKNAKCTERINEDCMCLSVWDPVCGCNDKTYSNAGCAGCSGIEEFTEGECE